MLKSNEFKFLIPLGKKFINHYFEEGVDKTTKELVR